MTLDYISQYSTGINRTLFWTLLYYSGLYLKVFWFLFSKVCIVLKSCTATSQTANLLTNLFPQIRLIKRDPISMQLLHTLSIKKF